MKILPITKRQKDMLSILYRYIQNTGYPPTFEEMRESLGVSSNQSVIDLLSKLEDKRFIKRNEGGIRHRGHHDRRWYLTMISEELLSYTGIRWPYKPLNYSSDLLTIDTNNIAIIDYKAIVQFVVQA